MNCNLCGSEDNKLIFNNARLEAHNILQCKNCGLVFLEIGKTQEEIERFYREEYRKVSTLPIQTAEQHYNDPVTKKDVESQLNFILTKTEIEGRNILEVGSASGGLLERLRDMGAKVSGIELNDDYREFCKDKWLNIYSRPIEYLEKRMKRFDLIISFHVVEHFVNPMESIRAIYSCLKPNIRNSGLFIGEVPNHDEWGLSVLDSEIIKQLHYNPYHYYYFTQITLAKYLRENGFHWMQFETIERYNSLEQLRRIILYEKDIGKAIDKSIFPKNSEEDLRLRVGNIAEQKFNQLFGKAVNEEQKGSCLRFVANRME